MSPRMTLATGAHAEGWSRVGGTSRIKRCLWASLQHEGRRLLLRSPSSLLRPEFCCKMTSVGLLAFIGGLVGVWQLVKLVWRCWCGFRQFVLSACWQVDLRSYGKWAGKPDICTNLITGIVRNVKCGPLTRLPSLWCVCSCHWCHIWYW